jgi:hypothetical protein
MHIKAIDKRFNLALETTEIPATYFRLNPAAPFGCVWYRRTVFSFSGNALWLRELAWRHFALFASFPWTEMEKATRVQPSA